MNKQTFFSTSKVRFRKFLNKRYAAFNSLHRVVSIGVLTGCALASASLAQAQTQTGSKTTDITPNDTVETATLDEVTVTASLVELPAALAARQVTIADAQQIAKSPVNSLQDYFNQVAGIDLVQRGGHGVQADISIRGGTFDQTAIMLNGVNISNPQTGHYSMDIPVNLSDIHHIEFLQGPAATLYGASAFSGAINVITKQKSAEKLYASIQTGMYGLAQIEASSGWDVAKTSNRLSASYARSDGYITNSDYNLASALFTSSWQNKIIKADIQAGYNNKQYGANTFYSAAYPNQYDKTSSILASAKVAIHISKLKIEPLLYWTRHYDCFQLFREGTPNLPDWYTDHNYHRTDVLGGKMKLSFNSAAGFTALNAEIRNEKIMSNVLGKPMQEAQWKYTHSDERTNSSISLEHNLVKTNYTVSAAILANANSMYGNKFTFYPAINASWRFAPAFNLYAAWNKAERMPTFTDIYYTTATHTGNTDIKPEYTQSFEAGIKYENEAISAYLSAFYTINNNLIDWVKVNPEDKWQSRNLTTIKKRGLEAGLHFNLQKVAPFLPQGSCCDISYSSLFQDKQAEGLISNYVLNYLSDKCNIAIHLPLYREILSLHWNYRWQKRKGTFILYRNSVSTGEVTPFPAFSVEDIKIDYKLNPSLKLNVTFNNLRNEIYYDLGNVPQSGFWLMGGLTYQL